MSKVDHQNIEIRKKEVEKKKTKRTTTRSKGSRNVNVNNTTAIERLDKSTTVATSDDAIRKLSAACLHCASDVVDDVCVIVNN